MSKIVVMLWIHSSRQIGFILNNFRSFGILQHIGKNSKQKEVENNSKYSIVNSLFREFKNSHPSSYNVVINNLHLMFLFFSKEY